MRLAQSTLQNVKVGLHTVQGLCLFVAMCIMFALFTQADGKNGGSDGRNRFYIALVFLTIPALIYQVGVPMWSRTLRFANVYAFLSVDALFTIFWLAAFAGVAAWVRAGVAQGATNSKISYSQANCTTFAYGTEEKCHLGNAAMGFGLLICALFVGTCAISTQFFFRTRRNPTAKDPWLATDSQRPSYSAALGSAEAGDASKDQTWDASIRGTHSPFGGEEDDGDIHAGHGGDQEEDEHTLLHSTETDEGRHPGRRWDARPGTRPAVDTEYRGAGYQAPSALSPSSYGHGPSPDSEDYTRPTPPPYTFSSAQPLSIPDLGERRV